MKKYAFVDSLAPLKYNWSYAPWKKLGAIRYKSFDDVPIDSIVVTYHHPGWLDPLKSWIDRGGKYIEIEWGYWGEINDQGRVKTRRVTYCDYHNITLNKIPYPRAATLTPEIQPWHEERGDYLLIVEPNADWIFKRTGMLLGDWREYMLKKVEPFWSGSIKWRRKSGVKNGSRYYSFREDLKGCWAVIGERTMACTEAVMLGYPAYTVDVSAVTPLMGNDLSVLKDPILPDRSEWLEHIAWSQFHESEFNNGAEVALMVEEYQINR